MPNPAAASKASLALCFTPHPRARQSKFGVAPVGSRPVPWDGHPPDFDDRPMYPERTKERMGAGSGIIQNYGSLTLEVEILRYGKKPRDKGGRPPKREQSP